MNLSKPIFLKTQQCHSDCKICNRDSFCDQCSRGFVLYDDRVTCLELLIILDKDTAYYFSFVIFLTYYVVLILCYFKKFPWVFYRNYVEFYQYLALALIAMQTQNWQFSDFPVDILMASLGLFLCPYYLPVTLAVAFAMSLYVEIANYESKLKPWYVLAFLSANLLINCVWLTLRFFRRGDHCKKTTNFRIIRDNILGVFPVFIFGFAILIRTLDFSYNTTEVYVVSALAVVFCLYKFVHYVMILIHLLRNWGLMLAEAEAVCDKCHTCTTDGLNKSSSAMLYYPLTFSRQILISLITLVILCIRMWDDEYWRNPKGIIDRIELIANWFPFAISVGIISGQALWLVYLILKRPYYKRRILFMEVANTLIIIAVASLVLYQTVESYNNTLAREIIAILCLPYTIFIVGIYWSFELCFSKKSDDIDQEIQEFSKNIHNAPKTVINENSSVDDTKAEMLIQDSDP